MSTDQPAFTGTIPEHYERHLVPILFETFANVLANRAEGFRPRRVLELACGTGALTRSLVRRLPSVQIVATDLSESMVNFARDNCGELSSVEWRVADACCLPFEDGGFDLIVCQFGVMFFPDKLAAMSEMHRVLAPAGTLIFNTWGELAKNPIFSSIEATLTRMFPDEETPFMPTPVSLPSPEVLRSLAAGGGFAHTEAKEIDAQVGPFPPADLASGFVYGTPLGAYLKDQGYDLEAIRLELSKTFAESMGDPMQCDLLAVLCTATKSAAE